MMVKYECGCVVEITYHIGIHSHISGVPEAMNLKEYQHKVCSTHKQMALDECLESIKKIASTGKR